MASFNTSDINEAKRRVEEMRRRARSIVDETPGEQAPVPTDNKSKGLPASNPLASFLSGILGDGEDNSSALVLALILILSKEKADNMLILALLYILL